MNIFSQHQYTGTYVTDMPIGLQYERGLFVNAY